MHRLKVARLPSNDSGRLLVRVNKQYRSKIKRYGIANLKNETTGKSHRVLMLGHDRKDAIFMPYDIREALGVKKGAELKFSITPTNWFGKMHWYLCTPDPAVHIPARLTVIAIGLAIIGLILAIMALTPFGGGSTAPH